MTTPKDVLAQLPTRVFRRPRGGAGASSAAAGVAGDAELCAVCQADYEEGEVLATLPCRHCYHRDCVNNWLESYSRACPVCKEAVC
jgi:hypothetical protein